MTIASKCRACGASIHWLKTSTGRTMPVDSATVVEADTHFESPRHVSHFATCPEADRFRKKK